MENKIYFRIPFTKYFIAKIPNAFIFYLVYKKFSSKTGEYKWVEI